MCNHKEMYCITNCVCEPVLSKLHAKFMTQFPLPLLTFLEYSSQWGYLCYTWDCSLHTKGFTKQGGDGPHAMPALVVSMLISLVWEYCRPLCFTCSSQSVNHTLPQCQVLTLALACTAGSAGPHLDFCLSVLATSCSLMPAPVWQFLERSLHRTTGMGCLYHASEKT